VTYKKKQENFNSGGHAVRCTTTSSTQWFMNYTPHLLKSFIIFTMNNSKPIISAGLPQHTKKNLPQGQEGLVRIIYAHNMFCLQYCHGR
jgi:hypothetical protein